jgi:hypothetical protein
MQAKLAIVANSFSASAILPVLEVVGMKKRIGVKAFLDDIRSGAQDAELMAKYDLPRQGLYGLFRKLLDSKAVTHAQLYKTSAIYRERINGANQRRSPRAALSVSLPINEMGSSSFGVVRDISETGLRIAGIRTDVGEIKTFQLPIDTLMNASPPLFVARCRWVAEKGDQEKYWVAGFEFIDLSEADRSILRNFINFLILSKSGEWRAAT